MRIGELWMSSKADHYRAKAAECEQKVKEMLDPEVKRKRSFGPTLHRATRTTRCELIWGRSVRIYG